MACVVADSYVNEIIGDRIVEVENNAACVKFCRKTHGCAVGVFIVEYKKCVIYGPGVCHPTSPHYPTPSCTIVSNIMDG